MPNAWGGGVCELCQGGKGGGAVVSHFPNPRRSEPINNSGPCNGGQGRGRRLKGTGGDGAIRVVMSSWGGGALEMWSHTYTHTTFVGGGGGGEHA